MSSIQYMRLPIHLFSCATVQTARVQTQTKKIQPLLPQQQMSSCVFQYIFFLCNCLNCACSDANQKNPTFASTFTNVFHPIQIYFLCNCPNCACSNANQPLLPF